MLLCVCSFYFCVDEDFQYKYFLQLFLTYVFKSLPKDRFIDFRERGRERERSTHVREKHRSGSVASRTHPNLEWNTHPRYVLQPGIEPANFWCTGQQFNQPNHLARAQI